MKAFVITILDNEKSQKVATRCVDSAAKYDLHVEKYKAFTPKDDVEKLLRTYKVLGIGFKERFSHYENCVCAFISHFTLWEQCAKGKEDFLILEHDAYFVDKVPKLNYTGCISLGKPSYGTFITPSKLGVNPLTSKRYFPGAHAYIVKPKAAEVFVTEARLAARPTDVFLTLDRFPWLEEYYPWPVEARDSFSTIQNVNGCLAKHNYGKNYATEKVS